MKIIEPKEKRIQKTETEPTFLYSNYKHLRTIQQTGFGRSEKDFTNSQSGKMQRKG